MVIKVGNIGRITFKSNSQNVTQPNIETKNQNIQELSNVTPDFAVKIPQKYSKLGEYELFNGLKLHSYKLSNGYKVSVVPMEGSPVVVKNYVNVGSLNETNDIKGISHFLEHMAFNGTNGSEGYMKLNTGDSFRKIDKLGGWANASTNYAITDYVNSAPGLEKGDLEEQIRVIAAMTEDLALTNDMIEKEKGAVCSEINMILDDPQTILTDQTVRTLFGIKSSADELVGGSVKHIKSLTREQVKKYYDKYYTPQNMNLVVTGDVNPNDVIKLVSKHFKSQNTKPIEFHSEKLTPINKTVRKDFISDKATSTGIMLGFEGPKSNNTKDNIIFDFVLEYLNSTELGLNKELKKINAPASFGLDKISAAPDNRTMLFCTLDCAENKSEDVLRLLFQKFSELTSPSDLEVIKERLIQRNQNRFCYSTNVNNIVGEAVLDGSAESLADIENIINNVTADDIKSFISKYLDLNKAAITVIHPQINKNESVSFKGSRVPIKTASISVKTLDNNIETAFQTTKNDNICFDLNFYYDNNEKIKPAARCLLDVIYSMGTANTSEDEFNDFEQKNNILIQTSLNSSDLNITGYSGSKNSLMAVNKTIELLQNPALTEENLKIAKDLLKDSIERHVDTAESLYVRHEAKNNLLYTSIDEIKNDLDAITLNDLKNAHKYILENARATFTMNIPESKPELKEAIMSEIEKLPATKQNLPEKQNVYKPNTETSVITKDRQVSQADINETFKFKINSTPKESAIISILTSMLSSSSIGLFDTLREKEHLAYSVRAVADSIGDCGNITLKILTTTENENIGEISYENIQKSINGFNRQLNALMNSEYTDEDLENAKRQLKATILNLEGVPCKVNALSRGLNTKDGIEYDNNVYNEIDSITREDIDDFAKKIFKNSPVYTIVASKNSLEANKDFLNSLKTSSGENL